jgi:hypothetical protein
MVKRKMQRSPKIFSASIPLLYIGFSAGVGPKNTPTRRCEPGEKCVFHLYLGKNFIFC